MKSLMIILLFLAGLAYAGYYLYMFDKKNGPTTIKKNPVPQTPTDVAMADQSEKTLIPVYLKKDFWQSVTPQELENQLKTISNVNEVRPDNKRSMLHLLVKHGNYPEMVKMLIDAGVDYNLMDEVETPKRENRKALFYTIFRENQSYEFIQALLEYDDVNSFILDNDRATALMLATYRRKPIEIIQLLLKKGADPNITTRLLSNSLISASLPNETMGIDPQVIQLLLDHNANITAKNIHGKTAFDYMKENEEFKKTELFKKIVQDNLSGLN